MPVGPLPHVPVFRVLKYICDLPVPLGKALSIMNPPVGCRGTVVVANTFSGVFGVEPLLKELGLLTVNDITQPLPREVLQPAGVPLYTLRNI